jgi:N-acylneuraminate cytidylyltransferase
MECIAIIPARGGSKGIPRKNSQLLAGKPLIAYTVEHALAAHTVNRLIVSTDDPEIASISQKYGAEVVLRPPEISGDTASSEAALLHALKYLERTDGYKPDLVVFLQCTSPLITPADIDGTVQVLLDEEADSALAVTPFHSFLWQRDRAGAATAINHDKSTRPLRQDRELQYLESGAVYVMRTWGFLQSKHRFFGKTAMYIMPQERGWEIDEPVDLTIAQTLLGKQQGETKTRQLPDKIAALVLDFDGVFTDNSVIVSEEGHEAVICNRSDGMGLSKIRKAGIPIIVLSTEENPVVSVRCRKLGLGCLQGLHDKRAAMLEWLGKKAISSANTVYLGNDINDLSCMEVVGCSVAVGDADPSIIPAVSIVLAKPGGHGAIRELCDLILTKMRGQTDA